PLCTVTEGFVLVIGEKRPTILHATVDTAVLVIADAIQFTGLGHRQRLQQHGMNEREYRRGRADSECQRQDSRHCETRSMGELSQRVSDIFHDLHNTSESLYGRIPTIVQRIEQESANIFDKGDAPPQSCTRESTT